MDTVKKDQTKIQKKSQAKDLEKNKVVDREGGRTKKQITNCKHTDAKHYAKGMCNHCYHINGRKTAGKARACPHTDKSNYCKGLCMNCYINRYNRDKKQIID